MSRTRKRWFETAAVAVLACAVGPLSAAHAAPALPTGGKVVAGSASIGAAAGGSLSITQSTSKAIIDWNGFSIGSGGKVSFANGSGATLNRVTGAQVSSLDGLLSATGSVYLINPNGVIVGRSGVVNVGGSFVASTLDTSNAGFLSGGALSFCRAQHRSGGELRQGGEPRRRRGADRHPRVQRRDHHSGERRRGPAGRIARPSEGRQPGRGALQRAARRRRDQRHQLRPDRGGGCGAAGGGGQRLRPGRRHGGRDPRHRRLERRRPGVAGGPGRDAGRGRDHRGPGPRRRCGLGGDLRRAGEARRRPHRRARRELDGRPARPDHRRHSRRHHRQRPQRRHQRHRADHRNRKQRRGRGRRLGLRRHHRGGAA